MSGTVDSEIRIQATVAWESLPQGTAHAVVTVGDENGHLIRIGVEAFKPPQPARELLKGFVETEGSVSIEAEHFTRCVDGSTARWEKVPDLGSTLSGMTTFPVTAPSSMGQKDCACLEYQMYLFDPHTVEVESILSPSLNFVAGRGLSFAASFDDQEAQIESAVPEVYPVGDGAADWERTVRDGVRRVKSTFTLDGTGYHTLKIWRVDPGIVLQKIVVNLGGVKPSYLGPPESPHNETK
jgi:hypothetical protein